MLARLLDATLVVPHLVTHSHWNDDSTFGDIYSMNTFKKRLEGIVRVANEIPNDLTPLRVNPPYHSSASRAAEAAPSCDTTRIF
eukprot:7389590-Pyramimonas_sp.AAC.2